MKMPLTATAQYVSDIANEYNVRYRQNYADNMANTITQLAGDSVQMDETELLLIALKRAKILSGSQMIQLHAKHLKEKKHV